MRRLGARIAGETSEVAYGTMAISAAGNAARPRPISARASNVRAAARLKSTAYGSNKEKR